jgi:hypothetical protein
MAAAVRGDAWRTHGGADKQTGALIKALPRATANSDGRTTGGDDASIKDSRVLEE